MRLPSASQTHAFTRIEAAALTATLLLFALLSFPVAANNRAQTKTTLCFSNLRHLIFAWQLYATDHDGILVGNSAGDASPNSTIWVRGLMDWTIGPDNTNIAKIRDPRFASLSDYILTPRNVHKCPADVFQSSSQQRIGMHRVRSVVMNSTLGSANGGALFDPLYRQATNMAQLYLPAPAEST